MPETGVQSAHIHERAKELFQKPSLQEAYRSSTLRLYTHRLQAISEVPGFRSETGVQSAHIHERAKELFQKPSLQEAYRSSTLRLYTHRLQAISEVPGF